MKGSEGGETPREEERQGARAVIAGDIGTPKNQGRLCRFMTPNCLRRSREGEVLGWVGGGRGLRADHMT